MNPGEGLKCSQYKLAGKMEGTSSGEYDTVQNHCVGGIHLGLLMTCALSVGRDADTELFPMAKYLLEIAAEVPDWRVLDHSKWKDGAEGAGHKRE